MCHKQQSLLNIHFICFCIVCEPIYVQLIVERSENITYGIIQWHIESCRITEEVMNG